MESSSSTFLKLVSLNIERNKHIPQVLAFLKQKQPEVVCLQEVFLQDFEMFKKELGMEGTHAEMIKKPRYSKERKNTPVSHGIGLLSSYPFQQLHKSYYYGDATSIQKIQKNEPSKEYGVLLYATLKKDGVEFTIGTTHFTWTPDGKADETQRKHLDKLLLILKTLPEIIFSGDFNAPRGGEIFTKIAERYTDHIPKKYTTSIDKNIHRAGDLKLMVDGLFSTPHYTTANVRLVEGVSDHMAIIAEVKRTVKTQPS